MMHLRFCVFAVMVAVASDAFAQRQSDPPFDGKRSALPPPSLEDKGTQAPATMGKSPTVQPDMPDTRPVREKAARNQDAESIRTASDSVTSRREGSDTVEEYREKGRVRMIRIVQPDGGERLYIDGNGDGRLDRDARDGPVAPVYFTIYEWD